MKKLLSSVLAFLFIGSTGIPVSASSPDGDQRPSISVIDSNSDFQKLNIEGYHLEPGERIVTEKDYLGLQKDNGEAVILDINNKIKGFIKYGLDTNAKEGLLSNEQNKEECMKGIAIAIVGALAACFVWPVVVESIEAFGLEAMSYWYYEAIFFMKTKPLALPALAKAAIDLLQPVIGIPKNCFGV